MSTPPQIPHYARPVQRKIEFAPRPIGPELSPQMQADRRAEADRIYRAWMLAPTIEIYEALMKGEDVPISALDPVWVDRFGMRR